MRYLALMLFVPTSILAWLYWSFPRGLPRSAARRRFDLAAMAVALVLTVLALETAIETRFPATGPIWPQVFAVLAVYHVFPIRHFSTSLLAPPLLVLAGCTGSTDPATATLFDNIHNLQTGEYDRQIAEKDAEAAAIISNNNAAAARINAKEGQIAAKQWRHCSPAWPDRLGPQCRGGDARQDRR